MDMLSPVFNAFEHIRDAFTKPPYVPSDLSPGISFFFCIAVCDLTSVKPF